MKKLNDVFKTQLCKTIEEIEDNSLVEVVLMGKQRSGNYIDTALWVGIVLSLITFTLLMFLPIVFGDYLVYIAPIAMFTIGYAATYFIKPLGRKVIGNKRIKRNVEIMARAIFQKGEIRHTNSKIGVLFYLSFFEKIVYILPDKGAELMVPPEEWDKIQAGFTVVFERKDYDTAIIEALEKTKAVFNQYIPPIENDINELPDDMEIDF